MIPTGSNGALGVALTPSSDQVVSGTLDSIQMLLDGGTLDTTQANGLSSKLENTLADLAKGKTTAVCGKLKAFINDVIDLTPPLDLVGQAQPLIDAASQIRDDMSCKP